LSFFVKFSLVLNFSSIYGYWDDIRIQLGCFQCSAEDFAASMNVIRQNSATLRVGCYYTGLSKKRAAFVIAQGTFGRGELGKGLGAYMRYILGPEHSTEGGCGGIHHEIYQHTSLFFVSSRICWPRLANMDVSLTSNFCVEHDVVRHPSNNPSRQEYLRVHDNLLFTIHDS
jgi:hypothetical protein